MINYVWIAALWRCSIKFQLIQYETEIKTLFNTLFFTLLWRLAGYPFQKPCNIQRSACPRNHNKSVWLLSCRTQTCHASIVVQHCAYVSLERKPNVSLGRFSPDQLLFPPMLILLGGISGDVIVRRGSQIFICMHRLIGTPGFLFHAMFQMLR